MVVRLMQTSHPSRAIHGEAPCREARSRQHFSDSASGRSASSITLSVSLTCIFILQNPAEILSLHEDSATQMVEVIWPLSAAPCRGEGGSGAGVLPLRTYIEETLRRSRTSYSTLQVALYYLVLIKTFVPKTDFTREQPGDCHASRALMCGRRMFLAALILASKYLQDRNYSAKAWSKMSGLKTAEINANERVYLDKINWKLHIPDAIFKRWTELVLKYTPNTQPPSPGAGLSGLTWKRIVPILTPQLDTVPLSPVTPQRDVDCLGGWGMSSPLTPTPIKGVRSNILLGSSESTPTALPRTFEPRVDMAAPPTPALARQGPLPTPQLTPSSVASSTPAVSTYGDRSRRPSMCSAMATAQQTSFNRCAMETYPYAMSGIQHAYPASRRLSVTSTSSLSSPESMMSDRSRSSRASSISSVSTVSSTSSMAPGRASCLAKQATCRNARLPMLPTPVPEEKEGSAKKPIVIGDDDIDMVRSPDIIDFTVSDKALHNPSKHTKFAPQPTSAPAEKSRKRARPRGGRRSDLHEEVRLLREEAEDMMDVDDKENRSVSPSPAANYAVKMLSERNAKASSKQAQPLASLSRRSSWRLPIQTSEGKDGKRRCCSTNAMSTSPSPYFGEVA